jgi:hypothetical protein
MIAKEKNEHKNIGKINQTNDPLLDINSHINDLLMRLVLFQAKGEEKVLSRIIPTSLGKFSKENLPIFRRVGI